MNQKQALDLASKEFEITANYLLTSFAKLLDTCPKSRNSMNEFAQDKKVVCSGFLNKEWIYIVKNTTCRFENRLNGQVLEVYLKRFGQKVVKNCTHFDNFLKTSPQFYDLHHAYPTEKKIERILDKKTLHNITKQQFYI